MVRSKSSAWLGCFEKAAGIREQLKDYLATLGTLARWTNPCRAPSRTRSRGNKGGDRARLDPLRYLHAARCEVRSLSSMHLPPPPVVSRSRD
jgi:hypothetical protein